MGIILSIWEMYKLMSSKVGMVLKVSKWKNSGEENPPNQVPQWVNDVKYGIQEDQVSFCLGEVKQAFVQIFVISFFPIHISY